MLKVVITRCSTCPGMDKRAKEVCAALESDLGLNPRMEEGAKGEFSVQLNGRPILRRYFKAPPSVNSITAILRNARELMKSDTATWIPILN